MPFQTLINFMKKKRVWWQAKFFLKLFIFLQTKSWKCDLHFYSSNPQEIMCNQLLKQGTKSVNKVHLLVISRHYKSSCTEKASERRWRILANKQSHKRQRNAAGGPVTKLWSLKRRGYKTTSQALNVSVSSDQSIIWKSHNFKAKKK